MRHLTGDAQEAAGADGINEMAYGIRPERRAIAGFAALFVAVATWSHVAAGGTLHMRDSTPAADAIIHGRHAEYVIRFDGPVDHVASRIEITQSGHVVQSLTPRGDSAVDVLFASGEAPASGHYLLRWWARSVVDGTVSEGQIPFSVEP